MENLELQFPDMHKEAIRSSLYRLVGKGRVCSVWRNFYVYVPNEYALRGFVPPIEYIDSLMRYLGHKYYVGLLSAAALFGSSHYTPQSFMVIADSNQLRSKNDADVSLRFVSKAQIQDAFLLSRNASYGEIKVSNPLLTALDMIHYENKVGGLERAASVIEGMADEIDVSDINAAIWNSFPIPVIQRLGYIVELVLGFTKLGDVIYNKTREAGIMFRKNPLLPEAKVKETDEYTFEPKWKIIVNTEMEVD